MSQSEHKFFSYIESRIQEKGELYARFHLGTFCGGQALTVANALRRTLLAEIPGVVVTSVEIDGANHEFATLPGIKENILTILLNIKKMALTATKQDLHQMAAQRQELVACLHVSGPAEVTAADIKFPGGIMPVWPGHPIATLGSTGVLKIQFNIQFLDPVQLHQSNLVQSGGNAKKLIVNTLPRPVRQVNYGIRNLDEGQNQEYISLEIWTDGTLDPKDAVDCALERVTHMFYNFTLLNKNALQPQFE